MRKYILFLSFLYVLFSTSSSAIDDRFNFEVSTDSIVGSLWDGTPVTVKEIDKMLEAVGTEKRPAFAALKPADVEKLRSEFEEELDEILGEMKERAASRDEKSEPKQRNIEVFVDMMRERVRQESSDPRPLKTAFDIIASKFL